MDCCGQCIFNDGEGGYTVWGKLLPAQTSREMGGLPQGQTHGIKLLRPVRQSQSLCCAVLGWAGLGWAYEAIYTGTCAYQLRGKMESHFCAPAVVEA